MISDCEWFWQIDQKKFCGHNIVILMPISVPMYLYLIQNIVHHISPGKYFDHLFTKHNPILSYQKQLILNIALGTKNAILLAIYICLYNVQNVKEIYY